MIHVNGFNTFKSNISGINLPKQFTYPFYYNVHPLAEIAAKELQDYIESHLEKQHNFQKTGKMFGVLVVQNQAGNLGYLCAFSGKLGNQNIHPYFVPPVFDMLTQNSFFLQEELILNQLNTDIEKLENNPSLQQLKENLINLQKQNQQLLLAFKKRCTLAKKQRSKLRDYLLTTPQNAINPRILHYLGIESIKYKNAQKNLQISLTVSENHIIAAINQLQAAINQLKTERKNRSNSLQKKLFEQYQFLNANHEIKNVLALFADTPPAAAGECAAPKLLQYAYKNNLQPICMAEFWWGASPNSEIRKQGLFYPACQSKCKPILTHMLKGLKVDANPLLEQAGATQPILTIYEDDDLAVINKPHELLSVPGKEITDSVATRMKLKYPNATGPLVVHRLDMATSGLMLIAKSLEVHEHLQKQFLKRTIHKRYVALLDGILENNEGTIDLPLRLDIEDRPRQMICYEHGKNAVTHWKKISETNQFTKVYFYPITGRTHQLRVHAAHSLGLNTPIVGDDLYGKKSNRLHLHAQQLTFTHPISQKEMVITANEPF